MRAFWLNLAHKRAVFRLRSVNTGSPLSYTDDWAQPGLSSFLTWLFSFSYLAISSTGYCDFLSCSQKRTYLALSVLSSHLCTSTGIFTWLFRSVPYFCIFLSFMDDNISFSEKKMMYIANYFQKYPLPLSRNHAPFPYFLVNFPRLFKCIHS